MTNSSRVYSVWKRRGGTSPVVSRVRSDAGPEVAESIPGATGAMHDGRASFRDLLGRIDAHLRGNDQSDRIPELADFWRAFYQPVDAVALEAFEKLLVLAQGQGFDVELRPFVEASRAWRREVGISSPHDQSEAGPGVSGASQS